ncbi:hypothetical protein D3C85_862060 [compost metagenome]
MPKYPFAAIKTIQKLSTKGTESAGKAYLPKNELRVILKTTHNKQAVVSHSQKAKLKLKKVPKPIPNKSELKL